MFSDRYKYTSEPEIQIETISDKLRLRIWNLFYQNEILSGGLSSPRMVNALNGAPLLEDKIADKLGFNIKARKSQDIIEKHLKDCIWYEVYNFIEIHISFLDSDKKKEMCIKYNELLEQEKSGYRVVEGLVVPITNDSEIESIKNAANSPFESVNTHIKKALEHYSDKKSPDYENSIKESISAVEAMCCIITGMKGANATLGAAINKLKDNNVHIHGAMESAFKALYGYTSDENGIRHGGIDFTNAPSEDAKFMLTICSAFINYLIEKQSKNM